MKKITSLKTLSLLISLFCAVGFGYGQTTLVAGDIAITGFNSDDSDEFTFVLLRDITINTTINFTDNGWFSSGSFRSGEGLLTWTATSDLSCGTEITIIDNSPFSASIGSVTDSPVFQLSTNGDQILAYQGTILIPSFIFAINFDGAGWSNATSANDSGLPTGLTNGVNAVDVGEIDNGNYNCTVTTNQVLTLAAVSAATNWNISTTRYSTLGGCTYTCVPCPTTTTWNGTTWSAGTSDINKNAIIAANYNTTTNSSFSACSLTVNAGFDLRVTNGHYVEVENDVVANGVITVETQGNFIQNNDLATFTDNTGGLVVVEKEKAMQTWYSYTYWSSPTKTETIEGVLGNTPVDRRFKFEAANFIDNDTEIGNSNLFINGTPDGLDDDGNDWQPATGLMVPGVGYAATANEIGFPYPRPPEKYNFYGEFNNGEIKVPLVSASTVYENWNLVGNPYPCAISADQLFSVNPGLFDVIYLWDQGTPPSSSTAGSQNSNFSQDDYAMINRGGTGSGSRANTGIPPLRFVPS
ncbi:MAG TPA: hypothetical protein PKD13_09535, partial [Mariniflexile sp.]|nr:hypothetical protein [Mariniflexile sp.]